jgi:hypothetical protein
MDFETATLPNLPGCTMGQNLGLGNKWTTVNNPGVGFTSQTLRYNYDSGNAANAWFYTQGIYLAAGQQYNIAFAYGNNSATYTEKMKVAYGTSPNVTAMTNSIVDLPSINQNARQDVNYNFVAPGTGVYYFGFNAYSDADQYYLFLDDIHITVAAMSTNEVANEKDKVSLYPNPFVEVLNITDVRNVKAISISDASGRLVKTILKPTTELHLGDLKTGMYMISLEYKDGTAKTIKAMKK